MSQQIGQPFRKIYQSDTTGTPWWVVGPIQGLFNSNQLSSQLKSEHKILSLLLRPLKSGMSHSHSPLSMCSREKLLHIKNADLVLLIRCIFIVRVIKIPDWCTRWRYPVLVLSSAIGELAARGLFGFEKSGACTIPTGLFLLSSSNTSLDGVFNEFRWCAIMNAEYCAVYFHICTHIGSCFSVLLMPR